MPEQNRKLDVNLQPIKTKRASEAIYEQIKEMIVSGSLKPGDRLPSERHMMEQLQRSRPTIREALRMLERSGFIRIAAGSNGAVVQEMSTRGVEQSLETMIQMNHISPAELAEYRVFNDVHFAEWAAQRRTDEDLERINQSLDRAEALIGDYRKFVLLDPEFHGLVAKASKNSVSQIITETFSRLNSDILITKMSALPTDGQRAMCEKILFMHQNIANAILARDIQGAHDAMLLHMQAFTEDLQLKREQEIS